MNPVGIIQVLDYQVANLIAAGEVVERPASCVKELLENALDAGATEITVEIKRGGVAFLRVTDNGCGMAREDLPIALKRHATSKIRTAADLDGILTLGFRGEALAAIASVCDLRIMTKRPADKFGSLLTASCGKVTDVVEIGARNGTTVIVENLFANVPARRKFLKRDASEAMAVSGIVEKIAVSRPDVAFHMISDGVSRFSTPGDNKLISAIYGVWGKEYAEKLVKVSNLTGGVEVIGYVSRPEAVRANRNGQNFFINSRYIRSKTATAALEQAFDSYCEVGKFPFCVLFIRLHPTLVDVNVHPTKLEVKFSNERAVFDAVYCAVRNTLTDNAKEGGFLLEPRRVTPAERGLYNAFVPVEDRLENTPTAPLTREKVFEEPTIGDLLPMEELRPPKSNAVFSDAKPSPASANSAASNLAGSNPTSANPAGSNPTSADPAASDPPFFDKAPTAPVPADGDKASALSDPAKQGKTGQENEFLASLYRFGQTDKAQKANASTAPTAADATSFDAAPSVTRDENAASAPNPAMPSHRIIGIAFNAYIIVETGDVTLILDKHAAHERILFERMKENRKVGRDKASQMLLLPLEVGFSGEERQALADYQKEIFAIGFDYTLTDSGAVVTEIPIQLSADEATTLLTVIAGELAEGTGNLHVTRDAFYEKALYQASCKAAMKAGIVDSPENIRWLVETVLSHPEIRYCPHGRPIAFELSKKDMEKFFKRT